MEVGNEHTQFLVSGGSDLPEPNAGGNKDEADAARRSPEIRNSRNTTAQDERAGWECGSVVRERRKNSAMPTEDRKRICPEQLLHWRVWLSGGETPSLMPLLVLVRRAALPRRK